MTTDKEETARVLKLALDDVFWAGVRAKQRTRVVGIHGTDFDARDARVERVVEKFNERAVKTAQKNALRAGWTKPQLAELVASHLASQGLGAQSDSGTAPA